VLLLPEPSQATQAGIKRQSHNAKYGWISSSNREWSTVMNTGLSDRRQPWTTNAPERQAGLEIVLPKRTYVLPWNQFLYAEGGDDEVRVAFTTHDVLIRGSGLNSLLVELAAQRIARLEQLVRADRLTSGCGRFVREVSVVRVEASGDVS
jgi:hypothetical protein